MFAVYVGIPTRAVKLGHIAYLQFHWQGSQLNLCVLISRSPLPMRSYWHPPHSSGYVLSTSSLTHYGIPPKPTLQQNWVSCFCAATGEDAMYIHSLPCCCLIRVTIISSLLLLVQLSSICTALWSLPAIVDKETDFTRLQGDTLHEVTTI